MVLGSLFLLAGIFLDVFFADYSWLSIILMLLSCIISYTGIKIHKKTPEYLTPLPKDKKKKGFTIILGSIFVGSAISPFLIHYQHPEFSLDVLVIISVVTFIMATGIVWYSFVRQNQEIEQSGSPNPLPPTAPEDR